MEFNFSPLAVEAAQLIAEGNTWQSAREQIAAEHGVPIAPQPADAEIESALRNHYAIFDPEGHAARLLELRETALYVMKVFAQFKPRLIRGVLNGCADKYSDIYLQIVSPDPKAFQIFLLDNEIEFEVFENPKKGKKEYVERVTCEAPIRQGGYFDKEGLTVWVDSQVFEQFPSAKKLQTSRPDPWQIEEEAAKFADIVALEKLIALTRPKE